METKHKPETPLPWKVTPLAGGIEGANHLELARMAWPRPSIVRQIVEGDEPRKRIETRIVSDAAYIAHAANAYPKLISALHAAIREADLVWQESNALRDSKAAGELARKWRSLLRDLGESE